MSNSSHCADCQRPIRLARIWGWDNGRDGSTRIPLDYAKSIDGEYAVLGPETAVYVKTDERAKYAGGLYTDHRRTCTKARSKADPDRPQMAKVRIACGVCQKSASSWSEAPDALKAAQNFIADHINCRGRKAS